MCYPTVSLRKLWRIAVGAGLLWSGTWLSVVLFIEQSIEQNTEPAYTPQELAPHVYTLLMWP